MFAAAAAAIPAALLPRCRRCRAATTVAALPPPPRHCRHAISASVLSLLLPLFSLSSLLLLLPRYHAATAGCRRRAIAAARCPTATLPATAALPPPLPRRCPALAATAVMLLPPPLPCCQQRRCYQANNAAIAAVAFIFIAVIVSTANVATLPPRFRRL